ncbi:hypothetical protein [Paenibacillus periandrae]|uniref:hypothetical protein n=1 Tax=Paenibacillus periandrae TaxID=1761741 RepID=UPI001F08BF22|nr:hypothetical protein [Paenibacillus periandrae]
MERKIFVVVKENELPRFYPTDLHDADSIPKSAIQITEDVWQDYLSNQHLRKFNSTGDLLILDPPTQEELDEIEANRPRTDAEKIAVLESYNASLQQLNMQLEQRLQATESAVLTIMDFI